MNERPEMGRARTKEQQKKDKAALEKAKEQEAAKMRTGAKYQRRDRRTFVLKKSGENPIN